jgi:hypothetical protein
MRWLRGLCGLLVLAGLCRSWGVPQTVQPERLTMASQLPQNWDVMPWQVGTLTDSACGWR